MTTHFMEQFVPIADPSDYRARYYDPNTGRFVSGDPIAFKGDINFYRYVGNRPILLADPTGLYKILDPDPKINTVVCDGKGGFSVQLGRLTPLEEKCIGDCARVHEESHIGDVKAADPKICKGKVKGAVLGFSNPDEEKAGETKAYTAGLNCLNNKLNNAFCKDCFQTITEWKQYAQEKISGYNNGKN